MPVANAHHFNPIHYNAIAKDIREEFARHTDEYWEKNSISYEDGRPPLAARSAVMDLALKLAKRFAVDSDEFNPLLFLERCSPDNDLYPITELWDA